MATPPISTSTILPLDWRGGKYSPVPCTRDTAHKNFGPTDLTSKYSVCTRRVIRYQSNKLVRCLGGKETNLNPIGIEGHKCRSCELWCKEAEKKNKGNNTLIGQTATAGSDVVQSGRPIFDDFFQHLWPYIGNNTANVVFQMVKRLRLIRIDQ
ncbi:hypothetical protein TNCV_823781 [Trichonephila clavipes]|nr:hypothetical protein TNCV_823781 [Trichonephila clavipes]